MGYFFFFFLIFWTLFNCFSFSFYYTSMGYLPFLLSLFLNFMRVVLCTVARKALYYLWTAKLASTRTNAWITRAKMAAFAAIKNLFTCASARKDSMGRTARFYLKEWLLNWVTERWQLYWSACSLFYVSLTAEHDDCGCCCSWCGFQCCFIFCFAFVLFL